MARLIVVSGPPCSGKSTLSRRLADSLASTVLDVDEIRKEVLPDSDQRQEDRNTAYRCMHYMARTLLAAGAKEVILAATYLRPEPRQWLSALARGSAAQVLRVVCHVDSATAADRFRTRMPTHAAIDLTDESVRQQARDYDYSAGLVVDSTKPILDCVALVLGYLKTQ